MICSRLKEVLPVIIDDCQGAFVVGRSIMDNILICQDMLKDYNNKRKSPRCTIKVDLRKAYDSVHWDFIRDMLESLGFPDKFIHWIMVCVSSPSYSLLLNGGLHGFFQDDLMLFAHGDRQSVNLIFKALIKFEKVSGLQENAEKTSIYFGNVDDRTKLSIMRLTGFVEGSGPFRLLCRSSRNLSYAARVVLINAVLISLHSYWAQCLILPKTVIQRIRAFLCSGSAVLSKAPPLAWSWVCKAKKVGGLGIRDCELWNKAALGKYIWQISKKKDSLWVKWVHNVYIKTQDWWTYSSKKADGWAWKKICRIKDELEEGFRAENWTEKKYSIATVYDWLQGKAEKHGISNTDLCLLCGNGIESQQHLFFDCAYSRRCLLRISRWLGVQEIHFNIISTWKHWKRILKDSIVRKIGYASLAALVYYLWAARNSVYWNQAVPIPDILCDSVCSAVVGRAHQLINRKWKKHHCKWLKALRDSITS
ncbi:uncharacterized protein LOC110734914 [Chenopodium quinoa]|uniref:uncharacterized protein LOC110734914 n=1 Tax=Chenopodium quinoa TaxID=63459 RepID=UPI000B790259|nr:uncharacterized protein LOC110734914 [Chenopodium quinoa]